MAGYDGAGAGNGALYPGGNGPNGLQGGPGAQGHFQDIEAPLYQRFGQRGGMAQLLDDDDRNEARAAEIFGKFRAWTLDFATLL